MRIIVEKKFVDDQGVAHWMVVRTKEKRWDSSDYDYVVQIPDGESYWIGRLVGEDLVSDAMMERVLR